MEQRGENLPVARADGWYSDGTSRNMASIESGAAGATGRKTSGRGVDVDLGQKSS